SAARKLIDDLKRSPGEYLEERTWQWITIDKLAFDKAKNLIGKTGGVSIQLELPERNSFLVSSKKEKNIDRLRGFINKVQAKFKPESPVEFYKLKHLQLTTDEEIDEFEESLEELLSTVLSDVDYGFLVNAFGQGVTYYTRSDRMSDLRSAIASMDTSAYEHSRGELVTFTPKYRSLSEVSDFLTSQNLARVVTVTSGKVFFYPKEDKKLILERLQTLDSTSQNTFSYRLQNLSAGHNVIDQLKTLANQLDLNVQFSSDAETNKIFFTTNQKNRSSVRSLLKSFDQAGFDGDRALLNFSPSYVSPKTLREPVNSQNLGEVVIANEQKITLLVPSDKKKKILSILKKIDDPNQTFKVVHLNRRKASSELISTLQTILSDLGISAEITADPKTNSILYAVPNENQSEVRRVIKRLDQWQKQVLIKAVLVEIRLGNQQRLNPQWIANPSSTRSPFINENQFDQSESIGLGYSLGSQGGDGGLSALLQADEFLTVLRWIKQNERSKVVTRPSVTALNNQKASIDLSEQRFYQSPVFDDEGNVVSTEFTSQSANKTLQVTPTITESGNIIMNVEIANDVFGVRPGPSSPFPVNRRVTQNQVLVNDGQTIVLGGFNKSKNTERVPYVSQLPLVGNLFKSVTDDQTRSELVIFLTPHVMESPGDLDKSSDRTFDGFEELEKNPDLMSSAVSGETQPKSKRSRKPSPGSLFLKKDVPPEGAQRENINTIAESSLEEGISESYADRIIEDRQKNGFYSGWSDLKNRLNLTPQEIKRLRSVYRLSVPVLNVNEASAEELAKLPNLDSNLANNIVDYRFQSGKFRSLQGLYQVFGIDEQVFQAIEPYLSIE
ncbi:MAG: helix-hairpin-helix domain-containing protein, partial [bacterium]